MPRQLSFTLRTDQKERYSLARFTAGGKNRLALDAALAFSHGGDTPPLLVLYGPGGSGKSHLLKGIAASCGGAVYVDCQFLAGSQSPLAHLEKLKAKKVLLLDGLHALAGKQELLDAVFHLFNAVINSGGRMVFSLEKSPAMSPFLPDYLSTRLLTGMALPLKKPSDEERRAILSKLLEDAQISLTPKALGYTLERSPRSVSELHDFVEKLEASLAGEKRIGLQLIRRVLQSNSG